MPRMSGEFLFKKNWSDASEAETSYTKLCLPALLSAFFGVATFLVFLSPWFAFLGMIAIILSLFAIQIICNSEGSLTGTSLAYFGLCSSVVALVSIAVFWSVYQYEVRREADQFFRLWFAAVQQGDVPTAKEYRSFYAYRSRATNAKEWWQNQYENKYAHRDIHQFVEDKLVRVLMALGDNATVSYYKTLSVDSARESDEVVSVYAVTFPAVHGGIKTFFVKIVGKRSYPEQPSDFKAAGWKIENAPEFYLPDEFKKNTDAGKS